MIHGGDITTAFSGDYKKNFLARSSGDAMRKAFEHYGLRVTRAHDRAASRRRCAPGALVWIKTTVDFNAVAAGDLAMPDGRTRHTVLGNDHAVVVIGFNADVVVIRDVLGPTSSNWHRPYEYEVDWPRFWRPGRHRSSTVLPFRRSRETRLDMVQIRESLPLVLCPLFCARQRAKDTVLRGMAVVEQRSCRRKLPGALAASEPDGAAIPCSTPRC